MTATEGPVPEGLRAAEADEAKLKGIQPHFHDLARKVGVDLFVTVYASNVFQHGIEQVLMAGQYDPQLRVHLQILGDMYNLMTRMLIAHKGWTLEQINAANQEAEEILRGKIIVPRAAGIILDS